MKNSISLIKNCSLIFANFFVAEGLIAEKPAINIERPNVIYVFADQLRAQALGFAGDPNVRTPNIDRLSEESLTFKYAVSTMPVSTPHRGCLMTGQFPWKNGMFINDIQLDPEAVSIGKTFKAAGYNTGYIGKWHINGHGRSNYIEKNCRQGFDYFKVLECTHSYMKSGYYDNDDRKMKYWNGYDAIAQTKDAIQYIKKKSQEDKPFILFLSWGAPHDPYTQAPQEYLDLYKDKEIILRANVPENAKKAASADLRGYYAHISALDECIGQLTEAIKKAGIEKNTILVFTSDHGDMHHSHALMKKQKPYDESIMVPFLLRYPAEFGVKGEKVDVILNTPDIFPTLLGLSHIDKPKTIQGKDLSPILRGEKKDFTDGALISCIIPSGQYKNEKGSREYRGIRTRDFTYVEDLKGPWLLFDNAKDPFQMNNIVNSAELADTQKALKKILYKKLKEAGDDFQPGENYLNKWGYKLR